MMVSGYMEFDEEYAEMSRGTGRDLPGRIDAEYGRDSRGFEMKEEVVRGQTAKDAIVLSDDSAELSPRCRQREENRRRGREAKAPIILSDDDDASTEAGSSRHIDTVPGFRRRRHHLSSTLQDQALGPDLDAGASAFLQSTHFRRRSLLLPSFLTTGINLSLTALTLLQEKPCLLTCSDNKHNLSS